jgi:hypothetical protein
MNLKYIEAIKRFDAQVTNLVAQAGIPDSPVARTLDRYQSATDLKTIFIRLGFYFKFGVFPETILRVQKKSTTSPGRA